MGSFNVTCHLSGEFIASKDEVVVVPISPLGVRSSLASSTWSYWAPIPIMIEGTYDGYGGLKTAQVFDSRNALSDKDNATSELLSYFHEYLHTESDEKNLQDYVGNHVSRVKRNMDVAIIEANLQLLEVTKDPSINQMVFQTLSRYGIDSTEKAREYCQAHQNEVQHEVLGFVFMKKDKLVFLLNNYGIEYTDEKKANEEIYAQTLQRQRQGGGSVMESVAVVSGGDYAGANKPAFTWHSISKQAKNKAGLNQAHFQQGIDLALVNEYMSVLGKAWTPTVTVHEDIKYYGHDEALEMQRKLVEKQAPQRKSRMK